MASEFYSQNDMERHGEMLANRCLKNLRHRRKSFRKNNTDAFRLYDWDIPEVRAVVDWYDGSLVVGEYVREQTRDIPWLETVARITGEKLEIPQDQIHLKKRQTRPSVWGKRYGRLEEDNHLQELEENGLKFLVNLKDFLDTGLFLDHRDTRSLVRSQSQGKSFLNLFAYTGSFSVYAAAGGASETCTVDLSKKYIPWARQNMENNGFSGEQHEFVTDEADNFIARAKSEGRQWDLIVLDPPSFSTRKDTFEFDIQRDHPQLIDSVLELLAPEGILYFSTNHQRFIPKFEAIAADIKEITDSTLPLDFKGKTPHRCFEITKRGPIEC